MIDWDKPIRQKNGRAARYVGTLHHHGIHIRFVQVKLNVGWDYEAYTDDGMYSSCVPSEYDLENIPQKEKLA